MARVNVTSLPKKRVKVTSKPSRKVAQEFVANAFNAKEIGRVSDPNDTHWVLSNLAKELNNQLRSTGGRPSLVGFSEKHKLPVKTDDWAMVEAISNKFPSVGVTQIAGLVFHLALRKVSKDEIERYVGDELEA